MKNGHDYFRRCLIAILVTFVLCGGSIAESKLVRLHPPLVSSALGVDDLNLIAATAIIPIHIDSKSRRWLVGVDFAQFLNARFEAQLVHWGHTPINSVQMGTSDSNSLGVLLELRDMSVTLTDGIIAYDGSIVVFSPNRQPSRLEFKSRISLGEVAEATLEPHELLSHDFTPLLTVIREKMVVDLIQHTVPLEALLDGKQSITP